MRLNIQTCSLDHARNAHNCIFVDVRDKAEIEQFGYIANALFLPSDKVSIEAENILADRDADLIVYCHSGVRSQEAVGILRQLGYSRAHSMTGGLSAWIAAGFPVQGGDRQLTAAQLTRHARTMNVPEIGAAGLSSLLRAKILIIGLGGLGCPAAIYLAAAGVGRLGFVDFDNVDLSNLQRQILFKECDVGSAKVVAAAAAVRGLNSDVEVRVHRSRLDELDADQLISEYDLIMDCTDQFAARFLINDICVRLGKPFVQGSVNQLSGTVAVFNARGEGPCYRCFTPEAPPSELSPNCNLAGVLGTVPGVIGVLQATEAIKYLIGLSSPATNHILFHDAARGEFRWLRIVRRALCECGKRIVDVGAAL